MLLKILDADKGDRLKEALYIFKVFVFECVLATDFQKIVGISENCKNGMKES